MKLPLNAKIWASVLFIILLTIASGMVYILTRQEAPPAPTSDTLNKHLESLQIRVEKKAAR